MNRAGTDSRERTIVWLFCALAAAHVFVFSAAFPFFNIVDEQSHFDLVVRYSHADPPRAMEPTSEEAALYIAVYGTPEYFWPRSHFTNGVPPPMWTAPEEMKPYVLKNLEHWRGKVNHEAAQPPLYYAIAGAWWAVAKACGLAEGGLLYTVRFLNVLFVAALVWMAYLAGRIVFPENPFIRLAASALMAVLPQSAFYSINNDMLSPVCFGLVFLGLLNVFRADTLPVRLGVLTGLALAATYLSKISNLPLLAAAVAALGWKCWKWKRAGALGKSAPALGLLLLCAAVPVGAWMIWTHQHFGDLTGSKGKIEYLGWTQEAFVDWWRHPIFTPAGFWTFLSGLIATLWQGEFLWYGERLTSPAVNVVYTLASLALLGITLAQLRPGSKTITPPQREALGFGFLAFAAGVAFLALLSVMFDFHDCFYPSREHPYFTSGRLISGALVPFLLLCGFGLDRALAGMKRPRARTAVLAGLLVLMLVAEFAINSPVFANPYNWFHL